MNPTPPRDWKKILFTRKMLICVFLGFTSGLPLWVLISLVPAWLRTAGVDLGTIGLLTFADPALRVIFEVGGGVLGQVGA